MNYRDIPEINEVVRKHQAYLKGSIALFKGNVADDGERAHFQGIDLTDVVFDWVDLQCADFSGCDLSHVTFGNCTLRDADFRGANVVGARVFGCWTYGSFAPEISSKLGYRVIRGVVTAPMVINGELTGYKVGFVKAPMGPQVSTLCPAIITLRIPSEAKKVVFKGDKCRCSCAHVENIVDLFGFAHKYAFATYNYEEGSDNFKYEVGKIAVPDGFNDNPGVTCSHGIHFFLTKQEALDYVGWIS